MEDLAPFFSVSHTIIYETNYYDKSVLEKSTACLPLYSAHTIDTSWQEIVHNTTMNVLGVFYPPAIGELSLLSRNYEGITVVVKWRGLELDQGRRGRTSRAPRDCHMRSVSYTDKNETNTGR